MPNMSRSSARSQLRRIALQVQRPRLRPGWRIAVTTLATCAAAILVTAAAYASAIAIVDRDWQATRAEPRLEQAPGLAAEQAQLRTAVHSFATSGCERDARIDVAMCDRWMDPDSLAPR